MNYDFFFGSPDVCKVCGNNGPAYVVCRGPVYGVFNLPCGHRFETTVSNDPAKQCPDEILALYLLLEKPQ
jgi:hypothetical protein